MRLNRTTLTTVTAVALAGIGAGIALAATGSGTATKADRSAAAITALAGKLGINSDTLSAALKATAKDRVAADLAAGTITKAQADAANARIDAGAARLGGFGGPGGDRGFGMRGPGGPGGALGDPLAAAATFLGVTEASLHTSLDAGKTLAAVAVEQGKTAAGLEAALVSSAKATLAKNTTLTDAQKTQILSQLEARTKTLVETGPPAGGPGHGEHGRRGGHGMRGGFGGGLGVDSLPVTPAA